MKSAIQLQDDDLIFDPQENSEEGAALPLKHNLKSRWMKLITLN